MQRKWPCSLFTSNFLNNFTQVKIKEACLTVWAFLHLIKFFSGKNTYVKKKFGIVVGSDKLKVSASSV